MNNLYRLGTDTLEDLFTRLDTLGGWPLHFKFLTVQHTTEEKRPCYFTNKQQRDEWNTTICSADDYYWWKLTAERKVEEQLKIRKEFAHQIMRQLVL